jgi:hypothetical protein
MVIVCEDSITRPNGKKGFYMDGKLKENLDYELKRVDKNWDSVLLYDGEEGSAKSTVACANAYYMANQKGTDFNDDKEKNNEIIYSIKEFEELLRISPPYTNIVWDEFVLAGMSLDALRAVQITLIKRMALMRKKRLVVHLIVPTMFMLSKYFAIFRPRCLIHVYSPDNLTRGSLKYYSKPSKRFLYIKGIKYWDYKVCRPDFAGAFTNTYGLFFDIEKYEAKKDAAMEKIDVNIKKTKFGQRVYTIITNLQKKEFNQREIAEICGFKDKKSIYEYIERYKPLEKAVLGVEGDENLIKTQEKWGKYPKPPKLLV